MSPIVLLSTINTNLTTGAQNSPAFTLVSDFRIEQLLDKIIDNAIDFHRRDSPIRVQLDVYNQQIQLTVANRGALLPAAIEQSVFDSMVSHRGQDNRLHFGLGALRRKNHCRAPRRLCASLKSNRWLRRGVDGPAALD